MEYLLNKLENSRVDILNERRDAPACEDHEEEASTNVNVMSFGTSCIEKLVK